MNYKDCFYYFIKKYKEQTGCEYSYYKNRLGLELMKIKRLGLTPKKCIDFFNWLYGKKKLSSINFLTGQLNDYYSSNEYREKMVLEETILHHKIMKVRSETIDNCELCLGYGRLENGNNCKCLINFRKKRDNMRKELK